MSNAMNRYLWARLSNGAGTIAAGVAVQVPWLNRATYTQVTVPADSALAIYRLDFNQQLQNGLFWRIEVRRPGDVDPYYTLEQCGASTYLMPPFVIPPGMVVQVFVVNGSAIATGANTTFSVLGILVPLAVYESWSESLPPFAPSMSDHRI